MNHNLAFKLLLFVFIYIITVNAYIDIPLNISRQLDQVSYRLPIKINDLQYSLPISLGGPVQQQSILSPKIKAHSKSKHKKKKSTEYDKDLNGIITATSLQGYSFEGWKRFFLEAFLYISQRYYHDIKIDLSVVKQIKESSEENQEDGVIKFGPSYENNKIYQQIKKNTEYIEKDYIAIYRGYNDKNARLQLGGYEENFARGHKTGVLFYIVPLEINDNNWMISVQSISCIREKGNQDDQFHLSSSKISLSLNIESPFLTLPESMSAQIERSLETEHNNCSIQSLPNEHDKATDYKTLFCSNMTSVDLALDLIKLSLDNEAHINISLYDLRRDYNDDTKTTSFYIRFTDTEGQWSIGESLFKSNYIVMDITDKLMMFSPVNRYPQEGYGVYIIRFMVGFGLFLILAGCGAMIWQTFNDPFRKNKFEYGQDGVRLVSYQKPNDFQD